MVESESERVESLLTASENARSGLLFFFSPFQCIFSHELTHSLDPKAGSEVKRHLIRSPVFSEVCLFLFYRHGN